MNDRQTLSYLSQRFEQEGLRPKVKYGQNFLIDLNLLDLLVRTAELDTRDVVLEVGTGAGSMTALMAAQAAHVITVEIDSELAKVARRELAACSNVSLLQMDALKNKNRMQDAVLALIQVQMAAGPNRRLKLVANLPYNVATPILSNLLSIEPLASRMVVTIQKELAQRITAKPKTKDYSALSIWIQSQCRCEIIRILPPTVFWPRPKVDSAILSVEPMPEWKAKIPDPVFFHSLMRDIFCHRRKYLRGALSNAVQTWLEKEKVDRVLADAGFDSQVRAEELSVEELLSLTERLRSLR